MLRNDFYAFVQKVFETVVPGATFSQNWSSEAVAYALQKVARGDTTRLIINIPPRNLKSICSSVALPLFMLGHDPTKKIICVSLGPVLSYDEFFTERIRIKGGTPFFGGFPNQLLT